MQLVVLSAVMTDAMMLPIIWRMVFHVSLLFFMVCVFRVYYFSRGVEFFRGGRSVEFFFEEGGVWSVE